MAMCISAARRAMPHRVAQRAMPLRSAPMVIRTSSARPSPPTPERTVRTQAASDQQHEAPLTDRAVSWFANYGMVLGIVLSAVGLYISLRSVITDSITVLSRELAASNREVAASITVLKSEQAANSSVLKSELNTKLDATNTKLDATNTKLDANTASIKELKSDVRDVNAKLENFSATMQAQQIETAKLQGLVSGLQEGVKKK